MFQNLTRHLKEEEIHARLLNWGRWLRHDNTIAKLGYPTQSPFVFSPTKGTMIADQDAEYIEEIVSSLHLAGINYGYELPMLYAFILKVEYVERKHASQPHVSQKAEDVRRRFNRPCAERTYYYHLSKAKNAILTFALPIK